MSTNSKPNKKRVSYTTSGNTALVLRTCAADMTAYEGFRWPEAGPVEAPVWDPAAVCGRGLHGLLWGEGDGNLLSWAPDAKWLVVEVVAGSVVDLDGKVKFPRGTVVHCGDRVSATRYLTEHGGQGRAIVGGTATAGDGGTATAGPCGTATAGENGVISIVRWDDTECMFRYVIGYIGKDGLVANTRYRLNDAGEFVAAQEKP